MDKYLVTGFVNVKVTVEVVAESSNKALNLAEDVFQGVGSYAGYGDCNHLIGVSGDNETISVDAEVEWCDAKVMSEE